MTISIKPTASGSTIEQDGSTILTVDGSGNISATNNFTATGHVLQVTTGTYATFTSTSSSTLTDTGLEASITPSSLSSKILVLVNIGGIYKSTSNTHAIFRLLRNSTSLINIDTVAGYTGNTSANGAGGVGSCYLDSPNTTSSVTYKIQFASQNNSAIVYINNSNGTFGTTTSTITLMEIAG